MKIRLKYGSYSHSLSEAAVSINRTSNLTDAGIPYSITTRWDVEGTLVASSQANLTTAINGLVAAYATDGQDALLQFEDASSTAHTLLSANTYGGVRVIRKPSFPRGDGAEYTTWRNFSISLEAEEVVNQSGNEIIRWEETVEIIGTGGARKTVIEVLSGAAQEQVTTTHSAVYATQRGTAVGRTGWPIAPAPIWPSAEQEAERRMLRRSPRASGTGANRAYIEYTRSWSYSFLANIPLSGFPHLQTDI